MPLLPPPLLISIRTLWKNKTYSLLNVAGLAIGITCAALIFLWVENEYSYNAMFPKKDNLYRVLEVQTYEAKPQVFVGTPIPFAEGVQKDIPGVQNAARVSIDDRYQRLFSLGEKGINEQGKYADASLLSMLDLPFVYGNGGFKDVHSVAISASMSRRFFGKANPIGRTLKVDNKEEYAVTGVFKDLPSNSSFKFQWVIPFKAYADAQPWSIYWGANGAVTYVQLDPRANVALIDKTLKGYLETKQPGLKTECFLFPVKDMNLRFKFVDGHQEGGKITYVRLFSLIAWIILLIACINFMNLSTARSERRAREVGVRKTMGARRTRLIFQFIGEALLLSYAAVTVSVVCLHLCLSYFNDLVQEQLSLNLLSPLHLGALLAIGALTGLAAGSYPAFYLSSFNPVMIFKGLRIKTTGSNIFIRKGLVVAQFTVSILLIISTIFIYQQVRYLNQMDLGYKKSNLLYLGLKDQAALHPEALRQALLATGVVQNAATSDFPITAIWNNSDDFEWRGKDPTQHVLITAESVGPSYLSTMHLHLKAGRDFYAIPGVDSSNVLINESLAASMGKAGQVGAQINDGGKLVTVVGIIKDFIFNNFYQSWGSLILYCPPTQPSGILNVSLKPGLDLHESLSKVGQVIKNFSPAYPFDYTFLDEEVAKQFKTEELTGNLASVFALLTIFISCLGLFGLAAYTAERRTKEIGIRKVLGASVTGLVGLLSGEFLQLVGISCLVAFPLAWWAMHRWLTDFAYRITLHWWVFILAGAGALVVALMTISFQAIRTALASPVVSLRAE